MVSDEEMIKEIKKHLKEHGFEEKGKTKDGITIFKKKEKEVNDNDWYLWVLDSNTRNSK